MDENKFLRDQKRESINEQMCPESFLNASMMTVSRLIHYKYRSASHSTGEELLRTLE